MKRASLIFFTGSLLLVMFFHQGIQANPAARLLTVYAIVESHHLYADPWKDSTIDKAELHGHAYWARRRFEPDRRPVLLGAAEIVKGPQREPDEQFAGHVADVVVAAIPFSFFGLALYRRVVRRMRPLGASFAALGALFRTASSTTATCITATPSPARSSWAPTRSRSRTSRLAAAASSSPASRGASPC